MPVDCKTISGRRKLRFNSIEEIVADAERLVASPDTRQLGNWPLDQLLMHLTTAINSSIDGISAKAPWYVRLAGPLLKRHIIKRGMSPGFKLPKAGEAQFFPKAASAQAAFAALQHAAARTRTEQMTSPHPVFGKLTNEEWRLLHLRHAELHLSFAVPES